MNKRQRKKHRLRQWRYWCKGGYVPVMLKANGHKHVRRMFRLGHAMYPIAYERNSETGEIRFVRRFSYRSVDFTSPS